MFNIYKMPCIYKTHIHYKEYIFEMTIHSNTQRNKKDK